ncbi:MAG: hypothetical protein GY811_09260 [Myxococcales bacterium]|nr:hypothetical protein [Myxococcales bacterium]
MASRDHVRAPGRLEVEFRSPSALLVAYTVNLSRGGMFLQCDDELPPEGAVLKLDIKLPERGIVSLTGVVAWHRPEAIDTEPRGVGVQFHSLEGELGAIVDALVLEYKGVRILVQSADDRDRRALLRRLKSIISTAEVIFASGEEGAREVLSPDVDLLIIDGDEDERGALATVRYAHSEFGTPTIALAQHASLEKLLFEQGASDVLGNPPHGAALRKAVLLLLSTPSRVTQPLV